MAKKDKKFRSLDAFLEKPVKKDPLEQVVSEAVTSPVFSQVKEYIIKQAVINYAAATDQTDSLSESLKEEFKTIQYEEDKAEMDGEEMNENFFKMHVAAYFLNAGGYYEFREDDTYPTQKLFDFLETHYHGQELYGVTIEKGLSRGWEEKLRILTDHD